ncbi:hypothetical protein N566_11840 [Streptomycetaceae bacterium MP113-05]|nr:hypothetical protein N566_11840 [Streptomycetaceae bacterium MP113-05]
MGSSESRNTLDFRELSELDRQHGLPDHTRRLIEACWDLDAAYPDRLLTR